MIRCICHAYLLSLCFCIARGQSTPPFMGARSMGMGHASSCLDDPWALFNNAAGLAKVNKSSAGFSFASYPEFDPFNRIAAVIAMPTSRGCVAMGIYKHGDDI